MPRRRLKRSSPNDLHSVGLIAYVYTLSVCLIGQQILHLHLPCCSLMP